ncbi:hypothetical protein [Lysobacter capsici]|uniref:hypothetical protein n=1 Tax=Lysobacter capsici TaxID=435897 RepID=UPI00287BBC41|nr:hypothetical protein [Lysobacter capsici]WND79476.1 hypothetical protein RJ610_19585 [Lysobacter capsici]WND84672.1 hypothetical protein RJ609_19600 [Lysobacter capsici]
MNLPSRPAQYGLFAALLTLMLATRFHHFGDALHLPDASMAVFFLGGLYLRRHAAFVGYLLIAVAIDYTAITGRGLSFFQHYCVTPSYAFLLLAYAALWYAGRMYAPHMAARPRALLCGLGVALLAASVSFLISNGAFYWWGGRYPQPHFAEYIERVWKWGPLFVRTTLGYVAAGFLVHALIARYARPRDARPLAGA